MKRGERGSVGGYCEGNDDNVKVWKLRGDGRKGGSGGLGEHA